MHVGLLKCHYRHFIVPITLSNIPAGTRQSGYLEPKLTISGVACRNERKFGWRNFARRRLERQVCSYLQLSSVPTRFAHLHFGIPASESEPNRYLYPNWRWGFLTFRRWFSNMSHGTEHQFYSRNKKLFRSGLSFVIKFWG